MEEADAKSSLPASIKSKVLSCNTSENIVKLWNLLCIKPVSTALATFPIPACNGIKLSDKCPNSTSFSKNANICFAIAVVLASGSAISAGLSSSLVNTIPTILLGSNGIVFLPILFSGATIGITFRRG
ncbi:hypothetical protein D3C76_1580840 [compost metagenome]